MQPFSQVLPLILQEYAEHVEHTLLVSDIPPCLNYGGGIFLNHMLQSMNHQIRHGFIVLNPFVTPNIPDTIRERMSIRTVGKPNEMYYPGYSLSIRQDEINAEEHIRNVILPELLDMSKSLGITAYWLLLEGQSMIRLGYELLQVTGLPVAVQVMDPPYNWLRAHNVDEESCTEIFQKYDYVMGNAKACAAGSWHMAERYRGAYGIRSFPVVPSLPETLGREPARHPGMGSPFKIALAGQIYAREEWNALTVAAEKLVRSTADKKIEIHAFTRDTVENVSSNQVPVHVYPWTSTELLLEALQEMDLLYCPYRFGEAFREESELCFPSKLSTYLASGKPVLFHGPQYSSPAKFLQEWDAAFACYSLNPDDLASVIDRAISDKDEYERISRNGARAFLERLSYRYLSASIRRALS